MHSVLGHIAGWSHWQVDLLAVGLLLQGAVVSVVPEELVILAIGALWKAHHLSFIEALLTILIGLIPANFALAASGRLFGRRLLRIRPFSWVLRKAWVDRALRAIQRRGAWVVFITRFIPTVRAPVYAAVGMSRFSLARFVLIDALASCIHVPVLFLAGAGLFKISSGWEHLGAARALLILAALGVALVIVRLRKANLSHDDDELQGAPDPAAMV